jgi:16S rRNA (cytidine1402-2'-O)-methyltransferase
VVPISGSSAFLNTLVASGLYYHHFTFLGFIPRSNRKQQLLLQTYKRISTALIIYESSHRLLNTLNNIKLILGNRSINIGREVTKLYEEFIRGSTEEIINHLTNEKSDLRGELTIIVGLS